MSWSFTPHGMGHAQSFLEEEKALNTSVKPGERNDKDISMAILCVCVYRYLVFS